MATIKNNVCPECEDYDTCAELCWKAKRYIEQDYVSQRESTYTDMRVMSPEDFIQKHPYPEGEIVLTTDDWIYFVKNYNMTSKQKRYLFLRYWRLLTLDEIGEKYNVSHQTVHQTIERFIEKVEKIL